MRDNIRPISKDVPLIQLGVHQCRFPVSEDPTVPGGYRFCAGPTSTERVYCDHHHGIVTAVDPRRARHSLAQRRAA
ncbi:GcrA family cell cycle regulator [Mesorhizobium sp.]|uniref:GcrA family cell cycle regulator n=1 Tax=Mesorhizobium sp. TaxID=1871066 RepID=UPI003BAA1DD1